MANTHNTTDPQANAPANPRHFLTIENPQAITNTGRNYGMVQTKVNVANIEDSLRKTTERGAALGKIASSMPSAMARLFIFAAALDKVNHFQNLDPMGGHEGVKEKGKDTLQPTPYHDLTGEMLDMLEFIFEYGDHTEFHVDTWHLDAECKKLEQSTLPQHHRLAKALRSAMSFGNLHGQPIYLFRWGDKVIGGSSPISLVYTSANLRTLVDADQFKGKAGNRLFADKATPLHRRDEAFQRFIYSIWLNGLPKSMAALDNYIRDSRQRYDLNGAAQAVANLPKGQIPQGMRPLTSQGAHVSIAGVTLLCTDNTVVINSATTDYMLAPTAQGYRQGNPDTPTPLALTPNGVPGYIYATGRPFNPASDTLPAIYGEMTDRTLPGLNKVKYPWIGPNDLLEDRIIEVSYQLNRDRFFTGADTPVTFMLPLKKRFFDYFTTSDLFTLDKDGRITPTGMLTMVHDDQAETVTVNLRLPLQNGKTITFFRQYKTAQGSPAKIDCYDGTSTFDLAFFPFYRLNPDNGNNVYNIMAGYTVDALEATFWHTDPLNGPQLVEATTHQRTRHNAQTQSPMRTNTDHINVDGAFSCVEITITKGKDTQQALVIPVMPAYTSDQTNADGHYTFAIDFGTTNTHVAYARTKHPADPIAPTVIKPFDYQADDLQLVMLNSPSGVAEFGQFTTAVKRELLPTAIGAPGQIKFPMRTTTYQAAGIPPTLSLFKNTNIGFNYADDITNSDHYFTNIKWDHTDGLSKHRMAAFFKQILWMMKNKSVTDRCTDTFNVVVTYPIAMSPNDKFKFDQAWADAKAQTKANANIRYTTESIAPYYSMKSQYTFGHPYSNVDIGGGTTDILYVNPITGEAMVFSALFAANDIWGDGLDKDHECLKDNGFVRYFKATRLNQLGDNQARVNSVIDTAKSSADIISYLFANDDWTQFSDRIQDSTQLKQIPLLHFTALAYYLAWCLHMVEVTPPRHLTFSGMGSKYIRLLNNAEEEISKIVNAVFHYAGQVFDNQDLRNAAVTATFIDSPKETTARGALIGKNDKNPLAVTQSTIYGYDTEDPAKNLTVATLSPDIENAAMDFYRQFLGLFTDSETLTAIADTGCYFDPDIAQRLRDNLVPSFQQAKTRATQDLNPMQRLNQPMFFWALKDALYVIGRDMANKAIQK